MNLTTVASFWKCTLYLQCSWKNMMGAGHHFAITQRLITLPLPPLFTALSLFSKPHIHLLFHGQLYAQVHTHTHTPASTECQTHWLIFLICLLSSSRRNLPSHTAVRCLAASVAPATSLTNLKLLYGSLQCPRADFPLLTRPNQSITANCSITPVKS